MSPAGGAGSWSSRCRRSARSGLGGLVLALALAIPAFRETSDEDWLKKSELAVTLPRPLRQRGRQPRHQAQRLDPARAIARSPDQGGAGDRGPPLLRAFRHRHPGHAARGASPMRAPAASCRAARRSPSSSPRTCSCRNERTIERKIKEAFLALWLETRLTKNEILKLYLDRAYMGGGTFGVDAAAQYYFGKSARDVNLAEAAMLAGLFKAPTTLCAAHQPAGRARARQRRARQPGRRRLHDRGPGVRRPPQPGDSRRPARRGRAQLLSRLGLRRDAQARRHAAEIGRRARLRGAHRARPGPAAHGRDRGREFAAPIRPRLSRQAGGRRGRRSRRRRARHGRRAATTARASSTARPTRCASPARRSSPTSMPPP